MEELEIKNENTNQDYNIEQEKSPEVSTETPSESATIEHTDANTINCLALTIQKDHKLVAIKNVFLRSIKISWKVIVSTVALTILKLLS